MLGTVLPCPRSPRFFQWTYIKEQVNKLKVLAIEEVKADPKHTLESIRTATIAVDKLFSVKNIGHHECFPMFLRLPAGGRKEVRVTTG